MNARASIVAVCAALALLAGCRSTRNCAKDTLFVQLQGVPSGADSVRFDVTYGGALHSTTLASSGQASPSVALTLAPYPAAGQTLAVTVTALGGGATLAYGTQSTTFGAGCTRLAVTLTAGAPLDMAAPPDLTPLPPDMTLLSPVLVGSSAKSAHNTMALALPMPAGSSAGNEAVLCLYVNSSTSDVSLSPGWTLSLEKLTSSRGFQVWALYRRLDGSAADDFSATFNTSVLSSAAVAVYGNILAPPTDPLDTHSVPTTLDGAVSGNSIVFTGPELTTTGAYDRLATFFVYDSGDGGSWTVAPTGMTKLQDTGSLALFDLPVMTPGVLAAPTATADYTSSNEIFGSALSIAVRGVSSN